jgi:AraC-like DNA-binding protein
MTVRYWSEDLSDVSRQSTSRAWRDLVDQAETVALAEPDSPLHISALCSALAVSERTLRKAFHNVHGLPPCRHLRMQRLSRARRALLSAHGNFTTVTEIATLFGFVELGRFSVEYRKVFGESPSATLLRGHRPGSTPAAAVGLRREANPIQFANSSVTLLPQ